MSQTLSTLALKLVQQFNIFASVFGGLRPQMNLAGGLASPRTYHLVPLEKSWLRPHELNWMHSHSPLWEGACPSPIDF